MNDILIVGAGFSGAVIARKLADCGYKVVIIDKRDHIAGNCFDYVNDDGIRIHKYGPHLFHTNNLKVVDWLSNFTEWLPYKHRVKAMLHDGTFVTLPVNQETTKIVGKDMIVDIFYRPYSRKMWGIDLENLDPDIFNRVKIRDDNNEYYFPDDSFQAMPKNGYTKLFTNILDHKNITIKLNYSYKKELSSNFHHTFNSMPIDEYYEFKYGKLPYRSIKFHSLMLPFPRLFEVATVNFTHSGPYTRVTEWKNIVGHGNSDSTTWITYEEPCSYEENNDERYYPVKDINGLNHKLYQKYLSIKNSGTTFIGRCGQYVYLDMHQAISNSISIANNFLKDDL